MTTNYPIIETQLRLIRALQKGYVEALEAGDWQSADYRAAHLHKLCEGLQHLSQLIDKGQTFSTTPPKNKDSWVNNLRSVSSSLSFDQPLVTDDNNTITASPALPDLTPEQFNEEWQNNFQISDSTSASGDETK